MTKSNGKVFVIYICKVQNTLKTICINRTILASNFATRKQFPDDFMLGTATGAFHVEGAWNEGKY